MTKKKSSSKGKNQIQNLSAEIADKLFSKEIEITSAKIKDDFCNYSYRVINGVGAGFTHNVKGIGIIKDDLKEAFAKFNVHLAVIDDVFKHSGIEIKNVDKLHNHELTGLFEVTGFKIGGGEENESISLIGNKYVSIASDRMELETPPIALDNLSGYHWYNELKAAADAARNEVQLYHNGKYEMPEQHEEADPAQLTIGHELENMEANKV